jgi:hypothetical protein
MIARTLHPPSLSLVREIVLLETNRTVINNRSLFLPQINRLRETYCMWGEDDSNVVTIPTQNRLTHQILSMWKHFKDLRQTFTDSCRAEQFRLRAQRSLSLRLTRRDSVLHTKMVNLESQEEDSPRLVLGFKYMSWLGQIQSHHRDEVWSTSLCQTFFASCVGPVGVTVSSQRWGLVY